MNVLYRRDVTERGRQHAARRTDQENMHHCHLSNARTAGGLTHKHKLKEGTIRIPSRYPQPHHPPSGILAVESTAQPQGMSSARTNSIFSTIFRMYSPKCWRSLWAPGFPTRHAERTSARRGESLDPYQSARLKLLANNWLLADPPNHKLPPDIVFHACSTII